MEKSHRSINQEICVIKTNKVDKKIKVFNSLMLFVVKQLFLIVVKFLEGKNILFRGAYRPHPNEVSRIRTCVDWDRQIYSLMPSAAGLSPRNYLLGRLLGIEPRTRESQSRILPLNYSRRWSQTESNRHPVRARHLSYH